MKINTDDDGVYQVSIPSSLIRSYLDGNELPESVNTILDEAQGHIYGETGKKSYVILEITDDSSDDN